MSKQGRVAPRPEPVGVLPHSGTNRRGQILLGCVRLLDIDVPDDLYHVLALLRLVLDVPDLAV